MDAPEDSVDGSLVACESDGLLDLAGEEFSETCFLAASFSLALFLLASERASCSLVRVEQGDAIAGRPYARAHTILIQFLYAMMPVAFITCMSRYFPESVHMGVYWSAILFLLLFTLAYTHAVVTTQ